MKKLIFSLMISSFIFFLSCSGETDVVDSGTYQGTVDKVVPEETEIYVETDDGNTLELYFTEETTLTKNGESVDFAVLTEGTKVEVEVEKVGKRLDPKAVRIIE